MLFKLSFTKPMAPPCGIHQLQLEHFSYVNSIELGHDMRTSLGTPGAAGMDSDIDAAKRRVVSVDLIFSFTSTQYPKTKCCIQ